MLNRCKNCHGLTWKRDECPRCHDGRLLASVGMGDPVTEHRGSEFCDPGNCEVAHERLFAAAGSVGAGEMGQ